MLKQSRICAQKGFHKWTTIAFRPVPCAFRSFQSRDAPSLWIAGVDTRSSNQNSTSSIDPEPVRARVFPKRKAKNQMFGNVWKCLESFNPDSNLSNILNISMISGFPENPPESTVEHGKPLPPESFGTVWICWKCYEILERLETGAGWRTPVFPDDPRCGKGFKGLRGSKGLSPDLNMSKIFLTFPNITRHFHTFCRVWIWLQMFGHV